MTKDKKPVVKQDLWAADYSQDTAMIKSEKASEKVSDKMPEKMDYFQGGGGVTAPVLVPETLSQADFSTLEIAKLNRKVALKEAEKALAQNESAEMAFKYVILQLYMKYKLDVVADGISDDGKIMRGALLNQAK